MQAVGLMLGIGGITVAGSVGASSYLFKKTIVRGKTIEVSKEPGLRENKWQQHIPVIKRNKVWLKEQNTELLTIDSFDGLRLRGIWLPADRPSNKLVIGLHGYKSRGENDCAALAHFYHNEGFNVLIMDHRAHGKSEGKYIGFGVLDRIDCRKWIELSIQKLGEDSEIYLHGISMGAATALMTAEGVINHQELPSQVKGIIADCAFTSAWDVFSHILKKNYHQPPFPILYLANSYCSQLAGYSFDKVNNLQDINKIKVPVLFIHGAEDDFVPTQMSQKMYAARQGEKDLLIIPGAGHGESYYTATELYQKTVRDFLKKCEAAQEKLACEN